MKSDFLARFVAENRLLSAGFDRFVFLPGMGFNSGEKWWTEVGSRSFPHEGVDLCLFQTHNGALYRLDETIQVPLIFSGKIAGLIPDFLGRTVIVSHRASMGAGEEEFYIFYAHVTPEAGLTVGRSLGAGEIIARIADLDSRKTSLPPHLHVSAAWQRRLPEAETISWPLLNQWDRNDFIDPLTLMGIAYEQITPAAAGPPARIPKWSRPS